MATIRELYPTRNIPQLWPRMMGNDIPDQYFKWLSPKVTRHVANIGVGVEIEVERVPGGLKLPPHWTAVADPSLRDNGIEFITLYGERVGLLLGDLIALKQVFDRATKEAAIENPFDFSERTSVHVHLDVRNLTVKQAENYLILYTLFETALFKYVQPERIHNIYCTPLRNWKAITQMGTFNFALQHWEKYCALNLATVRKYGTFEFRHMEGNLKPDYIFIWVMLLALLHYYACHNTNEEIREMISRIKYESHYQELVNQIFLSFSHFIEFKPTEIDKAASDAKFFFLSGE